MADVAKEGKSLNKLEYMAQVEAIRYAAFRITELETALAEAMQWNWLDLDENDEPTIPAEIVEQCRKALKGE